MSAFLLIAISLFLLLLIMLSALFSGSETALFSLTAFQIQRIRKRDPKAGARVERVLSEPGMLLSTLLVGNTLANFLIATLGFVLFENFFPGRGEVVSIPIMTVVLLLFGEVTPKRVAITHAEKLAATCSLLVVFWQRLLKPCNLLLSAGARVFRKSLRRERRALSNDELRTMVEIGEEQGVLDEEEASMLEGIMRLSELMASDEMTPRVDIDGIDIEEPLSEQVRRARKTRHRYMPVYKRTPDAIEGVLDTARFLLDPAHNVLSATKPALFIPENAMLDDLLVTFQRSGKHIACVLDEYGGTAGLITRGDILELITTPVSANDLVVDEGIRLLHGETWLVNGSVSLDEINHQLDLELEADDADRLSGWITFHAGGVWPRVGQAVEAQGCRATVRTLRKQRIREVVLEVLNHPEPDEDDLALDDDDEIPYSEEEGGLR